MNQLFSDKFFYHIYPLGLCACPSRNDFSCPPGTAFQRLETMLDRLCALGVNALYIGPVFESTAHGYDTLDYYHVDRRLGNNESFKHFCSTCHQKGIALVLDAVFNHTGRDFFAFKNIQQYGSSSQYKDWYLNLDFSRASNYGDCFDYEGWAGCKDLVKLNVDNPSVREHLFGAVDFWIEEFGIDGLRLDAADVLSKHFLDALSAHCKKTKADFWLMGEVVHGDYNDWVRKGRLDSVTNYQLYKALWSSLNDKNFFELSYNLDREFGEQGIYAQSMLYNFLDNHDVNRIASTVKKPQHLYLLYALLFCIPGIPSVYYGSEWGLQGCRSDHSDSALRPALPPFVNEIASFAKAKVDSESLEKLIGRFSNIRKKHPALQKGSYRLVSVTNTTLAFSRFCEEESLTVCLNLSDRAQDLSLAGIDCTNTVEDILEQEKVAVKNKTISVPANWLRIIR